MAVWAPPDAASARTGIAPHLGSAVDDEMYTTKMPVQSDQSIQAPAEGPSIAVERESSAEEIDPSTRGLLEISKKWTESDWHTQWDDMNPVTNGCCEQPDGGQSGGRPVRVAGPEL